ncbi:MlaA family lipoprotein [Sphingomonas immobilis]|uniref:VacJ family lipoprotein n=1 Tax=Sphingomonas immobilis TaxID=3063997 RepID=A0ABT9A3N6_9SPHN|nr:VacJ family lipoprotein [Sphingomonas sp. CA1-15]MDO7844454.1 VacJ family lipoprotein [Sphingomonas sp. CA1-15]
MSTTTFALTLALSGVPANHDRNVPVMEGLAPAVSAPDAAGASLAAPAALVAAAPPQESPQDSAPPDSDAPDIVVRGHQGDPLAAFNTKMFEFTMKVDAIALRPVAMAYSRIVPQPISNGIRNGLNNLQSPTIFVNFMLQHRIGKAAHTLARFVINSTIGIGGLFDIASKKPFRLRRYQNGFADTFGYYGVKPGVYLFLPVVGPTTLRDLVGTTLDRFALPLAIGKPFNKPYYVLPVGVFRTLDNRAQFDERLQALYQGSDPYAKRREDYFRDREAQINSLHSRAWQIRHGLTPSQPYAATPLSPQAPGPQGTPPPQAKPISSITQPAPRVMMVANVPAPPAWRPLKLSAAR